MKTLVTGLLSISALAIAVPTFADHHGDAGHGAPTSQECEALERARADAIESGEPMSEEDEARLERCGGEMEMGHYGEDHDEDGDHHDEDHGDHE